MSPATKSLTAKSMQKNKIEDIMLDYESLPLVLLLTYLVKWRGLNVNLTTTIAMSHWMMKE